MAQNQKKAIILHTFGAQVRFRPEPRNPNPQIPKIKLLSFNGLSAFGALPGPVEKGSEQEFNFMITLVSKCRT